MGFLSILSFAHKCIEERLKPGDAAIDATAGNGNDTVFMARLLTGGGHLYSMDIQQAALDHTRRKLEAEPAESRERVSLHLGSHAYMASIVPPEHHGKVGAVMFNLGYLPGQDHAVITTAESTLPALEAAFELLRPGGIITVVVYPGHPGGEREAAAVTEWFESRPQSMAQSFCYRFMNQRNSPPFLLAVEKRHS
jgi:16S rRNA C1402 N4-methylase RsmH